VSATNSEQDTASVAINWRDSSVKLIGGLPGVDAAEAWRLRTDIPFPAAPDRLLWRLYRPHRQPSYRLTDDAGVRMFVPPERCPGVYLIDPAEWGEQLWPVISVRELLSIDRHLGYGKLAYRAIVNRVDGDLVANMRAPIVMHHTGGLVRATQVILTGEHRLRHPLQIGGNHAQ
jgi:hypothetical protein